MAETPPGAIPLVGGRMAAGIVRLGDTVRRPVSGSSDFMAALLELFEQRGFVGAPKYLGRSEGADLLSFIPGDVPARFQPWSDAQVGTAASLLRAMHDATRGSSLAGRFDVVCHHDPGPNNVVFQDGTPTAFIDFAEAAPGSRLEDVAYMAWTWAISSKQAVPLRHQAEQVRLIADSYGLEAAERQALVDCILERQSRNVRFWAEFLARPETAPATPDELADRIEWSRREHAFVYAHRETFDEALSLARTSAGSTSWLPEEIACRNVLRHDDPTPGRRSAVMRLLADRTRLSTGLIPASGTRRPAVGTRCADAG